MKAAFAIAAVLLSPLVVCAITINTVPVGNANNGPDFNNGIFGAVGTDYRIGTTEVTNAQYVEFLNAVDAADINGLYNPFMHSRTRGGIDQNGSPGAYTYSVKADVPARVPTARFTHTATNRWCLFRGTMRPVSSTG